MFATTSWPGRLIARFSAAAAVLAGCAACLEPLHAQQTLFQETFDNRAIGVVPNPQDGGLGNDGDDNNWWSWNGPDSGNATHTWSFVDDGAGGAALEIKVDALLTFGTDWWWGLGMGKSGIYPPPGTTNFANLEFAAEMQILNPATNYVAPNNRYVSVHVEQWDPNATSPSNPEELGWWSFQGNFRPEFLDDTWQQISFTFDQLNQITEVDGHAVPGVLREDLQLNLRFDWNNGNDGSEMGLDDDNILRMDNLRITNLAPTTTPGDFNGDGNVDGADFVIWQTNFPNNSGEALLGMGDANGDGNVDGADFVVWQTNFPTTAGSIATVPEPGAWLLGLLAVVGGTAVACRSMPKRQTAIVPSCSSDIAA